MPSKYFAKNLALSILLLVVAGTEVCYTGPVLSSIEEPATGILVHNIAQQKEVHRIQDAHKGKVSGLCFSEGDRLFSCGVDTNIKMWDVSPQNEVSVVFLLHGVPKKS